MNISTKLLKAAAGQAVGAGLDVDEVFSTFLYDGTGATQVIENGIALGNSNDGGSAYLYDQGGSNKITLPDSSDFAFGTGDFTIEYWVWHNIDSNSGNVLDVHYSQGTYVGRNSSNVLMYNIGGGVAAVTNGTLANGQWHHIAFAREGTNLRIFINGVLKQTVTNSHNFVSDGNAPTIGSYYTANGYSFDGYMSNFRLNKGTAVYTSAFTPSTSALTAVSGTVLLCLQNGSPFVDNSSSSHTITTNGNIRASDFGPFTGTSGEGGLVWTKVRSNGFSHALIDTERGVNNFLKSNATNAQDTGHTDTITSFTSNGYNLGSDSSEWFWNRSGEEYVSWTFRKAPKFFDVVVANSLSGSGNTISHSLGCDVGMIIAKRIDAVENWFVWHRGIPNDALYLNGTNATGSITTTYLFGNGSSVVQPTSTQFTFGAPTNGNYLFYLFAHNNNDGGFGETGDQDIIKCGSVTADGSGNATVNLGFEPQWLMIKTSSSNTSGWHIIDNMRGVATGVNYQTLFANSSSAELTAGANYFEFTSTGFNINAYPSATNTDWVYMAIRRGPLAAPTDATKVFVPAVSGTNNDPSFVTPFNAPDYALVGYPSGGSWYSSTRLLGSNSLDTSSTAAQASNSAYSIKFNGAMDSYWGGYTAWIWKRAPSYFDVCCYIGNDTAGRTVSHNLGAVPEMMWTKRRNSTGGDWDVYHKDIGNTKYLTLNSTAAASTSQYTWNNTTPTESVFTIGTGANNTNGDDFIAYLFATVAGVSKLGSASHTSGSTTNVDCGFSSGARFIILKASSIASQWMVFDTVRGITSVASPFMRLNQTGAEVTSTDIIDPYSTGFAIDATVSTGTYIYYAIA